MDVKIKVISRNITATPHNEPHSFKSIPFEWIFFQIFFISTYFFKIKKKEKFPFINTYST